MAGCLAKAQRHERPRRSGLAVEQHRRKEEPDGEGPRRGGRHVTQATDDRLMIRIDESVPSQASPRMPMIAVMPD